MAEPRVFLKENRGRIEENYLEQAKNLPRVFAPVDEKLQKCTEEVALACKYLYAFMPYSDIGNYPFEVFLDYAENGVRLWKENPQVADLPEEIFLNYVLFHRVNEEEIAQCRTYFRTEIGSRIQGMNFREAALEVNYWCAEEATYHCTDDRTLSAISVYRRGNGRCGEESVFTVNALRSVGVPARQVYAPKWSHCDDNHAWVEIWCDGKWYFLGACEPEEIKRKRAGRIMQIQAGIAEEIGRSQIGQVVKVLIDRQEEEYYVGRTEHDSPEVDPEVLIPGERTLQVGEFYRMVITGADEYDLFAEIREEE